MSIITIMLIFIIIALLASGGYFYYINFIQAKKTQCASSLTSIRICQDPNTNLLSASNMQCANNESGLSNITLSSGGTCTNYNTNTLSEITSEQLNYVPSECVNSQINGYGILDGKVVLTCT